MWTLIWQTAMRTAVGTIVAAMVVGLILTPFRKELKKWHRAMDSIDPATETGVTRDLHRILHALHLLSDNVQGPDDDDGMQPSPQGQSTTAPRWWQVHVGRH